MIASLAIARIARVRDAVQRLTGRRPCARAIADRVLDREAAHLRESQRIALKRVLIGGGL